MTGKVTHPRVMLAKYTTEIYPQLRVNVKMIMPTTDAAYTASVVSLNRWVLSSTMPQMTEPTMPATTITRPMRPASAFAPWKVTQKNDEVKFQHRW